MIDNLYCECGHLKNNHMLCTRDDGSKFPGWCMCEGSKGNYLMSHCYKYKMDNLRYLETRLVEREGLC